MSAYVDAAEQQAGELFVRDVDRSVEFYMDPGFVDPDGFGVRFGTRPGTNTGSWSGRSGSESIEIAKNRQNIDLCRHF